MNSPLWFLFAARFFFFASWSLLPPEPELCLFLVFRAHEEKLLMLTLPEVILILLFTSYATKRKAFFLYLSVALKALLA